MDTFPEYDPSLKTPFCMVISGSTKCGKSTLAKHILLRRNEILDKPTDNVVYYYGSEQPQLFRELKEQIPSIEFHRGLPEEFGDPLGRPMLACMDDLMEESLKSKDVLNAFIRESHHKNVW